MKIYELKQNDDQSVQEGYYMKVTEILRRHSSAISTIKRRRFFHWKNYAI